MAAPDFGGLLSRAKAPALKPMEDVPEPEGEEEDGLLTRVTPIAQDIIDAIRGGDASALAEALIATHDAIGAGPSEAEGEIE